MRFFYRLLIFISLLFLTFASKAFPTINNFQFIDSLHYEGMGIQDKTLTLEVQKGDLLIFEIPNECRVHIKKLSAFIDKEEISFPLAIAKSNTKQSYWLFHSPILDVTLEDELLLVLWSPLNYEQDQCQIRIFQSIG